MAAEPGYEAASISVNRLSNIYDITLVGSGNSAYYSFVTNNYIKITNNVYISNTCYASTSIKSVNLHNISWVNNSMASAFFGCSYLTNVSGISNTITNADSAFSGCSYLTNAPTIPNSVISMKSTYSYCYNLVNVPSLPDNLVSIQSMFSYCNRIKNIPIIPESVTNMYNTFSNCTNLTGDIYIKSSNIINAMSCFNNTSLTKNVYIPFTYNNGINTSTYDSFITAGYKTDGSVNNVYLKDLYPTKQYNVTYYNYILDNSVLILEEYLGNGSISTDDDVIVPVGE